MHTINVTDDELDTIIDALGAHILASVISDDVDSTTRALIVVLGI